MVSIALTIGLLLALVIMLLAIPLTVMFSIHRIKHAEGTIRFRWLFGLVRFQLRLPQATREESKPKPRAKKKTKPRKKKVSTRGVATILKQSAFRQRIYKFIRNMLAATHARNLFVRLRIGLGDPADTGRLWAIIGPIAGLAQNLGSAEVCIEPQFIDPLLEVESHGQFRLVPIQFIALTTAFILSPTMLRAWWRLSRGNT
jgi:hypothetical protein